MNNIHLKKESPIIISIVGSSNSGKTTLLECLIPEMTKRGYSVGTIKHNLHGFEIDHRGKDSFRHKSAGAKTVVIASFSKMALIKDLENEMDIDEIVNRFMSDLDLVFTEGYKRHGKPKIEVIKKGSTGDDSRYAYDKTIIALVTDAVQKFTLPCFRHDQIIPLADFLEGEFFAKTS